MKKSEAFWIITAACALIKTTWTLGYHFSFSFKKYSEYINGDPHTNSLFDVYLVIYAIVMIFTIIVFSIQIITSFNDLLDNKPLKWFWKAK